jgi:hypothetical protein
MKDQPKAGKTALPAKSAIPRRLPFLAIAGFDLHQIQHFLYHPWP